MALTSAQKTTLKADIIADPAFNGLPNNSDGAFVIAVAYNLPAAVDFWVWRTSVGKHELVQATGRTGTTFIWNGVGFIGRSQGEISAWAELFNSTLACNPSLPNVRQAFLDIFSGTGNAALNRTHLDVVARRKATRAEKLFSSGLGLDTSAGAATMGYEGTLSYQDVEAARNS